MIIWRLKVYISTFRFNNKFLLLFCDILIFSQKKMAVPRNALFDVWLTSKKEDKNDAVYNHICSIIGKDVDHHKLKKFVIKLSFDFRSRWEHAARINSRFWQQNSKWLSKDLNFSDYILDVGANTSRDISKTGRPEKSFLNLLCAQRSEKLRNL